MCWHFRSCILAVAPLFAFLGPLHADTWTELAPMHEARAEPAVAAIGEKLYVFGGHDYATGATFDSVQAYEPSTDTWEAKNSMPGPRRNSAVAVAGDTVYVLGGQTTGSAKFRTTWIYDPSSDTWASGSDIPGSYQDGGRCDASAISVGGEIWLVGGYDGAAQLSRVDIYDPVADSWRSGPSLTQPAQSPMLFEHGGLLYALHTMWAGGVEVCDPHAASPSWTEISDLGELYWAVWARVADKVYGIGYNDHHQVIVYDIPTNSWSHADPSPPEYPVWATYAATIGNTAYIPGGLGATTTTDRLLAYTPASTFSDVPFDHWAFHEIEACHRAGIVSGYGDGTYRPIWTVTRDQMAAYISRALALGDEQVPTGPAQASFPDVLADHWAYDYVEYALSQNVVAGYEDGLYHPAGSVDRAQMAVFIARAICGGEEGVPSPGLRPIFSDVTDSNEWSWCYTHVQYLGSHGIVSGYPGGLYHPEYLCSRDQMAVYIARAFGLAM